MATQNPVEQEGTYPLPEAQVDRFMLKTIIDYPQLQEEQFIVRSNLNNVKEKVKAVVTTKQIEVAQTTVREIYMDEKIETKNLASLIELGSLHSSFLSHRLTFNPIKHSILKFIHFTNRNSKAGSRKNIAYHYDLGNEFYGEWLDPSMTYSSAIFETEHQGLNEAQFNKYKIISELAEINPEGIPCAT